MKHKSIILYIGIALLLASVFFVSCSTKKNTFTRRFYHNMTSRYNAYFNGNESYKEGVAELEKDYVDNYSKILPVYKIGTLESATTQSTNFDRAYKKASIVISRHSILIRKKEHVKWIPEAYLLIGKSYFYKQDYKLAAETFIYITKKYKEFPTRYFAMLWLAKTYTQQKKYDMAQSILDEFSGKMDKNIKQIPRKALKDFPVVYADFFLKQENNESSIEYLMSGIDKNKKKVLRVRLRFILAQVYQEMGRLNAATKQYDKVIRMNPEYQMTFNAKINKAMCYDATSGNSKELIRQLNKMAKEEKNKEYLDQIYYALAEICMKEKDTTCAIANYKLSATKSVSNNNQKATSYLKLARLYFAKPKYELAEMYYDSTMTVLPKDYPDYSKISALAKVLRNLVKNIRIVELQDSLQKLSKMTLAERSKVVDDIITSVIKEEQKLKEEAYQKQLNINQAKMDEMANSNLTAGASSWYFYNPNTINFGKSDFAKKWGNRKLEDLWRLTNKTAESDFGTVDTTSDTTSLGSTSKPTANQLKDKNYYLKNIPTTPEDIKKSNALIIEALYKIGTIYQNDLRDLGQAIESYDKLLTRFPDDKNYALKTYYQLYLAYDDLNNESKRDYYKNLICTNYAESDYCNIIKDPNYKKKSMEHKDLAADLYKETYNAYKAGNWDSVIARSAKGIQLYGSDTSLVPKFTYLKALAYAKHKDSGNVVKTLQVILDKYPTSNVKSKAQDLLEYWTGKIKAASVSTKAGKKDSISAKSSKSYTLDEDAIHIYVMVVNVSKTVKVADIKNLLSDFNTKNFSLSELSISNIFLDNARQIISVSNFPDKAKAIQYFNLLRKDKVVFAKLKPTDYLHFVISVDNYPTMYKNKDIDNYYTFFKKNYAK